MDINTDLTARSVMPFPKPLLLLCLVCIGLLSGCTSAAPNQNDPAGVEPDQPQGVPVNSTPELPPSGSGNDEPVSSDQPLPTPEAGDPAGTEEAQVTGFVTDAEGQPIAGASVAVPQGSAPVPEMIVLTGTKGEYTWYLPPGSFQIAVYMDGYDPQSAEVTVQGGDRVPVNFMLKRSP